MIPSGKRPQQGGSSASFSHVRLAFVDHFRGFICLLMLVGHSSFYLNSFWNTFDKFDPLYWNLGQFSLRYAGSLVAPGFWFISGAMAWYSFNRRMEAGVRLWEVRRHLIYRGLFLVVIQLSWVNASWGGFKGLHFGRFGIIGAIGISLCLMAFLMGLRWQLRLVISLLTLVIYPFLVEISQNPSNFLSGYLIEVFVTAGKRNSYPVLPWLGIAMLGSVIAFPWFKLWIKRRQVLLGTVTLATILFTLAVAVRLWGGYGNVFSYSEFGDLSFFIDQKYPPSMFYSLWFTGMSLVTIGGLIALHAVAPRLLLPLQIIGKVPFFFYLVHIPILAILTRRLGFFYREGEVTESLVGGLLMLFLMLPLCYWFADYKKRKGRNHLVQMF